MSNDDEYVDWNPTESPSSPPPPETLAWVEAQLGDTITDVAELVGGISSAVHRLSFASRANAVLRRFTLRDWMEREPYIPHDEARNLTMLGTLDLGVATPRLIAADPDGVHGDVPAIVMTEVPGKPLIDPPDPISWSECLAECLARIHEQPVVADLPRFRRWDQPGRPLPNGTTQPDVWRAAIDRGKADLPAHPDAFLHRDYHPNNVHWIDGEICGVVDWLSACTGPIAGDLSHCRWNLAILHSPELAEHFTDHYRSLTGYSEDVVAFDLATVLSGPVGDFPTDAWNALGRVDLTPDVVAPRVDAWLRLLVES